MKVFISVSNACCMSCLFFFSFSFFFLILIIYLACDQPRFDSLETTYGLPSPAKMIPEALPTKTAKEKVYSS